MRHGLLALWRKPVASTERPKTRCEPRIEGLETRLALSTASLAVAVTSARTTDSQSVTFEYDVNTPNLPPTLDFGVYRSADPVYDAGDMAIGSTTLITTTVGRSTLDGNGQPATATGHHTLTLPIEGGLKVVPDRPYVLIVANPQTVLGAADAAARTGVIHTHSIAVVTHGGIQSKKDDALGPPWQRKMVKELKGQGYDTVIKYNWSSQSRHPGKAVEQGPKLARVVNHVADGFPAGDPVDVHFIGHSEGAVVNSRADALLQVKQSPGIALGYIKMTMLDPHAANNDAPGHQYSIAGGLAGRYAKAAIRLFQWDAADPIASVPKNVDEAEVFHQHTQVKAAKTNHGIYNLWGQVPVLGKATYYDLTGPGISHSGDFGVPMWYTFNVVPTLHDGGHFVDPTQLTGSRVTTADELAARWLSTSTTSQPTFKGTSAPGATITLFAVPSGSYQWLPVNQTVADATGHWQATPTPLHDGHYRFAVRAASPAFPGHPTVQVTPRLRLGSVAIRASHHVSSQRWAGG